MSYEAFVQGKLRLALPSGISAPGAVSSMLFPFQRECVTWALERGRAALFMDCGLGKTPMQLEWARLVAEHTGGRVLILAPLAVAGQTVREGRKFGVPVTYAHDASEQAEHGITITNYERLDRFNPSDFAGVVLDESSILKSYSGTTKRAIVDAFKATPFRLACTATPAPNDTLELGNHAEFLGVLSSHEMIARWFLPDTSQMGTYRLKGHAVEPFWDWVTSWARCVGRPSDLGYSDEGYVLPPIDRVIHVIDVDVTRDRREDRDGQVQLIRMGDLSATNIHKEKRLTVADRARKVAELVRAEPNEPWILWVDTDYEDDALRAELPDAISVRGSDPSAWKEQAALWFSGDYVAESGRLTADRPKVLISKGRIFGLGLNWQHCARMAYVGPSFSFEQIYQTERRIYRFGQQRPVQVHVVMAATEVDVWGVAQRKAREHEAMASEMFAAARRAMAREDARATEYKPRHIGRVPAWVKEGIAA